MTAEGGGEGGGVGGGGGGGGGGGDRVWIWGFAGPGNLMRNQQSGITDFMIGMTWVRRNPIFDLSEGCAQQVLQMIQLKTFPKTLRF